jgi:hypothetical protein
MAVEIHCNAHGQGFTLHCPACGGTYFARHSPEFRHWLICNCGWEMRIKNDEFGAFIITMVGEEK